MSDPIKDARAIIRDLLLSAGVLDDPANPGMTQQDGSMALWTGALNRGRKWLRENEERTK